MESGNGDGGLETHIEFVEYVLEGVHNSPLQVLTQQIGEQLHLEDVLVRFPLRTVEHNAAVFVQPQKPIVVQGKGKQEMIFQERPIPHIFFIKDVYKGAHLALFIEVDVRFPQVKWSDQMAFELWQGILGCATLFEYIEG